MKIYEVKIYPGFTGEVVIMKPDGGDFIGLIQGDNQAYLSYLYEGEHPEFKRTRIYIHKANEDVDELAGFYYGSFVARIEDDKREMVYHVFEG